MSKIEYKIGGSELLGSIQHLWEQLNHQHAEISPHYGDDFRVYTFEKRSEKLRRKFTEDHLQFYLAIADDIPIGYCIAGIHDSGVGEIESLFIAADYRGQGIADELMRHALDWLDQMGVRSKVIDVAYGNERAFKFYAKFGFYPRVTMLKQKEKPQ